MNETAIAVGIEGKSLLRNAPSLLNVAFMETLFHDERETALETQVISPLLAADEMGNPSIGYLLARIRGMEDYNGLFETAFDRGVSIGTVGEAIASYMHDGSPGTLHEVLAFYNRGGHPHEGLDPSIKPLGLEKEEMDALEAFLKSLTGDNLRELTEDARRRFTIRAGLRVLPEGDASARRYSLSGRSGYTWGSRRPRTSGPPYPSRREEPCSGSRAT